jgi:triosephosphate isomerase
MARRPLIAGNWKMHKTVAEARAFAQELRALPLAAGVDIVVAPPFTALAAVGDGLAGTPVALCAQTMHEAEFGAFTGEISPAMLCELGVTYVILGHSERRAYNGENNDAVNRKVRSALAHGLIPIVAVGETLVEYDADQTVAVVTAQARIAFANVAPADAGRCVVAYEPIWAIGTGRSDTPQNANRVIGEIRASVAGLDAARLLYGGSMKPDNAAALLAEPEIDGGLIGGASLNAATFATIATFAVARAAA